MLSCILNCIGRKMGALWVWLAGFVLIVVIIVLLSTGNPWIAVLAAAAILVGWHLSHSLIAGLNVLVDEG